MYVVVVWLDVFNLWNVARCDVFRLLDVKFWRDSMIGKMQQIQIDSLLSNGWKIFDSNGGYVYLLRKAPLYADETERLRVNSFGFISESDY